jgi:hypothetical protein
MNKCFDSFGSIHVDDEPLCTHNFVSHRLTGFCWIDNSFRSFLYTHCIQWMYLLHSQYDDIYFWNPTHVKILMNDIKKYTLVFVIAWNRN